MSGAVLRSQGVQPPPPAPSHPHSQHSYPRRTSPADSVTLRHHKLSRDASLRASAGSAKAYMTNTTSSARRNSSGESHVTGQSDPMKWFDHSNENPTATYDQGSMDVDPPFFQREIDSSAGDKTNSYPSMQYVPPRLPDAQSSGADDYRSVIDDLTVEIKKLKEELKHYKQQGPDMLRKDKLFEIKIHSLPKRKKRELEATLRDFAAGLEEPTGIASGKKKGTRQKRREYMNSTSGSPSKHASSSSGSNIRPPDSGYASMSTGALSSGTSLNRPWTSAKAGLSEQKVESFLGDIPEGLLPRHTAMTEKEKKNLVVRRLEHLFTGQLGNRLVRRNLPSAANPSALAPCNSDAGMQNRQLMHHPPGLTWAAEPAREATLQPLELDQAVGKGNHSRDNGSISYSLGDRTDSGGNVSGSGLNTSPSQQQTSSQPAPPEQRPTRVKDLDPDRVQVPAENMEYIRHLGMILPDLQPETAAMEADVHPDADGWVYLNLLCNLAQLHIINVTPDFVRRAVSEVSTKFQLSPDGRQIRWRGGSEGTTFSSDVSGSSSQRQPEVDENESSEDPRKRQKSNYAENDVASGPSSKNQSKLGPQMSGSSASFHYKPLFIHRESSHGQDSFDDTLSSSGPVEETNIGESRWDLTGSGNSGRKKRRHDGAIIYYNGAPFCTDLSGDQGASSPLAYMASTNTADQEAMNAAFIRPLPRRTASGSSLKFKAISGNRSKSALGTVERVEDGVAHGLATDSGDEASELELDFPWTEEQQLMEVRPLEPCGLGGVLPDDHFMVVVTTKRHKTEQHRQSFSVAGHEETTDGIANRFATMSTACPGPVPSRTLPMNFTKPVEIEYISGRIKRLNPVPLPPPALFYPSFSQDSSSEDSDSESDSEMDDLDDSDSAFNGPQEVMDRFVNPRMTDDYPDGVELSSGDEDGEDPDDEPDARHMYTAHAQPAMIPKGGSYAPSHGSVRATPGTNGRRSASAEAQNPVGGSSVATAGEPGCSSSNESDESDESDD